MVTQKRNRTRKGKTKSKNEYNPENFNGDDVNVFGQKFQYPPTTEDKEKTIR